MLGAGLVWSWLGLDLDSVLPGEAVPGGGRLPLFLFSIEEHGSGFRLHVWQGSRWAVGV